MFWLSLIALMFVTGTFTSRLARVRGRVGWRWGAASTLGATLGCLSFLFVPNGLGFVSFFVGALVGVLVVLLLLWLLPERVPTLRTSVWPVYRLSTKQERAGTTELAVEQGALRIGNEHIAAGALTTLVADGECLRVAWGERELVLMPAGDERNARERAKKSQALAERIRQLLA